MGLVVKRDRRRAVQLGRRVLTALKRRGLRVLVDAEAPSGDEGAGAGGGSKRTAAGSQRDGEKPAAAESEDAAQTSPRNPGRLLLKALELLRAKNDEEWQSSSAVKNQMLRMDPSFQERKLGFASFTDFLKSRGGVVELDESSGQNRVRIRPKKG